MSQQPEAEVEFEGIPPRPDPQTWVAEVPGEPAPDPSGGRDADTEWMLRNS